MLKLINTKYVGCQYTRMCLKKDYYVDENGKEHVRTSHCCPCHYYIYAYKPLDSTARFCLSK